MRSWSRNLGSHAVPTTSASFLVATCWKYCVPWRGHRRVPFSIAPQDHIQTRRAGSVWLGEIHPRRNLCARGFALVGLIDQSVVAVPIVCGVGGLISCSRKHPGHHSHLPPLLLHLLQHN